MKPEFRKQEPPFCAQVELTRGCNLQCQFCGINGFQENPGSNYGVMTLATARTVAERIKESGWNCRIEFARRGEPTMNPHFIEIVRIFRETLPTHSLMMTSNGGGFLGGEGIGNKLVGIFEAGLDILALDDYKTAKIVPKIRQTIAESKDLQDKLQGLFVGVYEYPHNPAGNPHKRVSRRKGLHKKLSLVQDITEARKGTHAVLNNHTGYGGPLNSDYNGKACGKPFREVGINWDGRIDLCCVSWIGEYTIGNVLESTLEDLWQSDLFNAARQKLILGERDFRPCKGCDHNTYRPGLLPDQRGKATLPKPNEWTERFIGTVVLQGPKENIGSRAMKNVYPSLSDEEKAVWDKKRSKSSP